ncbi:MAG: enoyl-CoA hydratase/isomerase family protein [Candidatus Rokubacteria bacterium]|nr:enoyl-CoA hydratase/isomerase family protein [Candidatus Rokubacteria bacterium]
MNYDNIILETGDQVSRITLNRPPLNILDIKMMSEVISALREIRTLGAMKAVVITGAGGKCFSAGVEVRDHLPERVQEMLRLFHGMFREMIKLHQPIIAVVNGHALGGGGELALFCDMVIASDKSQFGQPDIKLGNFAPLALAAYPLFIWRKKVYEFLFTGDSISAAEAERIGLVNRVVSEDRLKEAEEALLGKLLDLSSVAIRASKMAMAVTFNEQFERALDAVEAIYLRELAPAEDGLEGLVAFLEKRQPVWKEK